MEKIIFALKVCNILTQCPFPTQHYIMDGWMNEWVTYNNNINASNENEVWNLHMNWYEILNFVVVVLGLFVTFSYNTQFITTQRLRYWNSSKYWTCMGCCYIIFMRYMSDIVSITKKKLSGIHLVCLAIDNKF